MIAKLLIVVLLGTLLSGCVSVEPQSNLPALLPEQDNEFVPRTQIPLLPIEAKATYLVSSLTQNRVPMTIGLYSEEIQNWEWQPETGYHLEYEYDSLVFATYFGRPMRNAVHMNPCGAPLWSHDEPILRRPDNYVAPPFFELAGSILPATIPKQGTTLATGSPWETAIFPAKYVGFEWQIHKIDPETKETMEIWHVGYGENKWPERIFIEPNSPEEPDGVLLELEKGTWSGSTQNYCAPAEEIREARLGKFLLTPELNLPVPLSVLLREIDSNPFLLQSKQFLEDYPDAFIDTAEYLSSPEGESWHVRFVDPFTDEAQIVDCRFGPAPIVVRTSCQQENALAVHYKVHPKYGIVGGIEAATRALGAEKICSLRMEHHPQESLTAAIGGCNKRSIRHDVESGLVTAIYDWGMPETRR